MPPPQTSSGPHAATWRQIGSPPEKRNLSLRADRVHRSDTGAHARGF